MIQFTKQNITLTILLFLVVVNLLVYGTHLDNYLNVEDLTNLFQGPNFWSMIFFIAALALLQPMLHIPSPIFLIVAGVLWDPITAFFVSWVGIIGSGLFCYFLGQYTLKDWVQSRLPTWLKRFENMFYEDGFKMVFITRFFFFTTPTLEVLIGATRVKFLPFLLATISGTFLGTLFLTQVGIWFPASVSDASTMMTIFRDPSLKSIEAVIFFIMIVVVWRLVVWYRNLGSGSGFGSGFGSDFGSDLSADEMGEMS